MGLVAPGRRLPDCKYVEPRIGAQRSGESVLGLGSIPNRATMSKHAKPIALSIDFDFFSYEDPMWDWGHRENSFFQGETMWWIRAQGVSWQGTTWCMKQASTGQISTPSRP